MISKCRWVALSSLVFFFPPALAQDWSLVKGASVTAGIGPAGMAAGDFNRDGRIDVAVGNIGLDPVRASEVEGISILTSEGNGAFSHTSSLSKGARVPMLFARDFNGDGRLDLLALENTGGDGPGISTDVALYAGNGDGSFQPAQKKGVKVDISNLTVGDLNSDGKLDFLVERPVEDPADFGILAYLQQSDGEFLETPLLQISAAEHAEIADFNKDGRGDLVIATTTRARISGSENRIHVRLRQPNGNWTESASLAANSELTSLRVADLNGDQILDLAALGRGEHQENGTLQVWLGQGDGTFGDTRSYDAGKIPGNLALGDLNGDGKLDLVFTEGEDSRRLRILLGSDPGQFEDSPSYALGLGAFNVILEDVDQDQRLDVTLTFLGGGGNLSGNPGILQFWLNRSLPIPPQASHDFNLDGHVDIKDAVWIVRELLNGKTIPDNQADFNGDGTVTIVDVRLFLQALLGIT